MNTMSSIRKRKVRTWISYMFIFLWAMFYLVRTDAFHHWYLHQHDHPEVSIASDVSGAPVLHLLGEEETCPFCELVFFNVAFIALAHTVFSFQGVVLLVAVAFVITVATRYQLASLRAPPVA